MSQSEHGSEPMGQSDTIETEGQIGEHAGREAPKKRILRAVAAQAAVLSAAVHFLWAWPRLGESGDPRPYVFVLGGSFAVAVAVATLRAGEYRRLYALGAGTLLAFLVGYAGWYGGDVTAMFTADPLAIVAKVAEAVGIVAFLALYRLAPPTSIALERRRGGRDPEATDAGATDAEATDAGMAATEGDGGPNRD
ncbi:hypothetical protein [Halorubrum sp. DTA46]|uniref:hypothetical protein n=1 Tax=Halorubrum sp. DTA46 TaxID=3402162 RepID=UPI003AACFEBE